MYLSTIIADARNKIVLEKEAKIIVPFFSITCKIELLTKNEIYHITGYLYTIAIEILHKICYFILVINKEVFAMENYKKKGILRM